MRVAIVHDWLYVIGGAERVLREILNCYPDADVFTLFDVLKPSDRAYLGFDRAHTSFLQNMPFIRTRHRSYLPLDNGAGSGPCRIRSLADEICLGPAT